MAQIGPDWNMLRLSGVRQELHTSIVLSVFKKNSYLLPFFL